jgi:hypothetical protein
MINWKEIGKERQDKYESKINEWNNTVMNYSEGLLTFRGRVEIKTDDWGVRIALLSEHCDRPITLSDDRPITLSASWEILSVSENGMSAAYVNWSLWLD